ncbi:hypothetical protein [Pontibacter anaerobius]|uniref:Uncharacterized protein n=1 Tax=Pontibacter anaerobius TaxID=2993940 RepID=A0ABT3RLF6_9BACT|nr:hypothetical protein [Pontibacter anaerobius]MCX2742213.1 hypothetical protein [Pontibacter anaerobius]
MDKKAKNILFKTYWTSQGWRREYTTPIDDLEYAKSKGVMFEPVSFSIPEIKEELNQLVTRIDKDSVVKGFLSSLTNKRLDWRSAIASYTNAKLVLEGKREFYRLNNFQYENEDVNVLNFERIKWSGVRHSDLLYNYVDLRLFERETITEPTHADIETFKAILKCVEESEEGEYPSKLRDRLKEAVKGSANERHTLMEILGCCEILKPKSYDRPTTGRHDWGFVEYWRGGDGYNRSIVDEYFGKYLK